MLKKSKLVACIEEKIQYLQNEKTIDALARMDELKQLLYIINKGCFDK